MAEHCTRQANLETACGDLLPTTGHYGCLMMMIVTNNRPKTDFRYVASLNNYRLATLCKPCGYVRDIPQQEHH